MASRRSIKKIAASQKARARILYEYGNYKKKVDEWAGCPRKKSTSPKTILRKRNQEENKNEQN